MNWSDTDYLEKQVAEVKSLAVGISRGLRSLEQRTSGPRARKDRRPSDLLLKAAVCELLRGTAPARGGFMEYQEFAADVQQRVYPADVELADYIERTAVSPAMTT